MSQDEKFVSSVLNRISSRSWKSTRRRRYLERLAVLTVGSDVNVNFRDMPTAACEWEESRGAHKIHLRSKELETGYISKFEKRLGSGKIHTLTQEGFLYHELGHVLITDFDAWMGALESINSMKKKAMAKQVMNATEDVVLEAWIRNHLSCGDILDFKNEVKFHTLYSVPQDKPIKATKFIGSRTDDQFDLLCWLIETNGRYDPGVDWDKILKDIRHEPWTEETFNETQEVAIKIISDAIQEPDARKRYEGIIEKFDNLIDARTDEPDQDEDFQSEFQGSQGGSEASQSQIQMMIPEPESQDDDGEEGGSGGSQPQDEEARSAEEILDGRDPEEVKVVM